MLVVPHTLFENLVEPLTCDSMRQNKRPGFGGVYALSRSQPTLKPSLLEVSSAFTGGQEIHEIVMT